MPEDPIRRELIERAAQGDADAFCDLVGPLQTRLFRQAMQLCGDPAAADDLVSETLIEAWRSLARYNHSCRLSTWLYAVLLHRHQKRVRKARRWPAPLAEPPDHARDDQGDGPTDPAAPGLHPAEQMAQEESARQVQRAIDSLSPEHQRVVRLRFFEGASLAEIATVTGTPIGTVKSRLHYALEQLGRIEELMNLSKPRGDT